MVRSGLIVSFAICSFSAFAAAPAAKDVTRGDIAGKTLCWNRGSKETYNADGTFFSTGDGKGSWETVSGTTITVHANTGDWSWTGKKLPDGSFSVEDGVRTAHYCK